jgi:hypothetical protein
MGAIIIKADSQSNKILSEFAKKHDKNVHSLNDSQFEDFLLDDIMDNAKTGKRVSRESVMRKLNSK